MLSKHRRIIVFLFLLTNVLLSQQEGKTYIGSPEVTNRLQNSGINDFSDPSGINMEIFVIGIVERTGKFIVPIQTDFLDLIALIGPTKETNLEDIRIYRTLPDSTKIYYRMNYEDILWKDEINMNNEKKFEILPGDVVAFPGSPRFFLRDYITLSISVISSVLSITAIIINLTD